ncbi:MAG: GTPase [Spirochaetota bacterium]
MPTNVPPEYKKAEEAFRAAKTIDEKIERLEDMIALLPKHKGTDHLYADLKRRMSTLRKQLEASDKKSRHDSFVEFSREGAAQVILIGPPNSGKSSLLKMLTNAHPEIGNYPFTTVRMQPGMVSYKDIQIQLVDTPPVTAEFMPRHLLGIVRRADGVLLVADASSDTILDDMEAVINSFAQRHIQFVREKNRNDRDSVQCRVIANKIDAPQSESRIELLRDMIGSRLDIVPISCSRGDNISGLPEMLFNWLRIVRVYTKVPGEKADRGRPYTVFAGQTVSDICTLIHKDFLEKFRFAKLWRGRDAPIIVSRYEPVQDGDILELHI